MIATSRMKTHFSKILLQSGLLLGFLISVLGLSAQLPTFSGKDKFTTEAEFALVTAVPKELCVGDVVTFIFKGKINTDGWHLYSSRTDGNIAYNPTMLEIFMDESKGIKLKGAMSENHKADEVDDKLMGGYIRSFHEKQVDFTQKLEITGPDVVLVGQFSSQTCTEEGMCKFLKLPIEWRIKAKACGTGAVVEPGVDSALTASNDTLSGVGAMPSFDFKPYDSTKTLSDNIKAQNRFFPDLSMVNGETGVCGFAHLEQARKYAEKVGRPLLLFFTSWTATSNRKMEKEVFQNPAVDSILRNRVVMVNLWADDKTKETGGVLLKNGTPAKTLGDYVIDLQSNTFNTIAQPLFALQDPNGLTYGEAIGYNADPVRFKSWLDSVITEYYKDKGIKEAAWLPKASVNTAPPSGGGRGRLQPFHTLVELFDCLPRRPHRHPDTLRVPDDSDDGELLCETRRRRRKPQQGHPQRLDLCRFDHLHLRLCWILDLSDLRWQGLVHSGKPSDSKPDLLWNLLCVCALLPWHV
jgi:thioredoxin-related protein